MSMTPNTLPRVLITRGAFADLPADVLAARIVAQDGTALLVRAIEGADEWTLAVDVADVVLYDDSGEREAA